MRIALFTDTYPPFINGVSTSVENLANILKRNGHDILVVAPRFDDGKLEKRGDVLYVPGLYLKKMYGYRIVNSFANKPLKYVEDFHPDLIHNHTDFSVGILAKRAAKKFHLPIVYTYHTSYEDYTYYLTRGIMDRFAKKIVRNYSLSLGNHVTEFITPSAKTKEYMRSLGSDVYINIIPTGIDFSKFSIEKFDAKRAEQFKKDHNIFPTTKVFLVLGRVAKEKSMDISIRGFAKYHEKHPEQDLKLIVVGEGPARNELELLTEELGVSSYVDFIGAVSGNDVSFYYHLADVYTSASITETQGLTFMEAMASGIPVLARYDTNLTDTITDNITGFFFTDDESFVNKCERIFSMSKEEISKVIDAAYEVVDKYSIDRFYTNIMRVYKRAVRKFW